MKWSVGLQAEADRVLTREEIVELADAVAAYNGVASGIGTLQYGARLLVEADDRDEALTTATTLFLTAAQTAGLPPAPIVHSEVMSEDDEDEDWNP